MWVRICNLPPDSALGKAIREAGETVDEETQVVQSNDLPGGLQEVSQRPKAPKRLGDIPVASSMRDVGKFISGTDVSKRSLI